MISPHPVRDYMQGSSQLISLHLEDLLWYTLISSSPRNKLSLCLHMIAGMNYRYYLHEFNLFSEMAGP